MGQGNLHKEEGVKRRILVVLGMHRSGTSLISAALEALGVSFGDNLIPGRADNPKGYWEDERLVELNNDVLAASGYASGDMGFPGLSGNVLISGGAFLERAVVLLDELLAGHAIVGLKDPRMPRLMLFWQAAFDKLGLQADYIVAARHPLSVADSLAARDHLSRPKALALWYEHSCRSLQWALPRGGLVVDYDRLLAAPREQLARLSSRLALEGSEYRLTRFFDDVLDDGLRHSNYADFELNCAEGVFPALRQVHLAMQGLSRDDVDPAIWGPMEVEFEQILPLLVFVGRLDQQLWRLASIRSNELARCAEVERELSDVALELEAKIQALESSKQELVRKIELYGGEFSEIRNLRENDQMSLRAVEAQLEGIYASRSWRITRPLRAIRRFLKV